MSVASQKPSLPVRGGAIRSALATGASILSVSGAAAIAGAYLAHKFGRDARTDGFLAAYSVYLVIVLAAQAFRLVIVPDLTRASATGRLTAEYLSYALAMVAVGLPASVLAGVFSGAFGDLLTGSPVAASVASDALPWLVPAAFAQMLAGLSASALAARDSYVVAAVAYALGAVTGLVIFITLASAHGLVSLAWGLAVNGAIAASIPLLALVRHGDLRGRGRGRGGERGLPVLPRLRKLAQAAAVPVAMQGLYVIALRGASELGEGNQTTLTYAYLFASVLVGTTASSLSLVSSAALTRRGLDAESASAHVLHAAWLSLVLIGAAAGVFAVVGGRVVSFVLGDAFSGDVGTDLGRLVIYMSLWIVAAVAFAVVFPLLFVLEKPRVLVPLAVLALAVDIPLSLVLRALFDLPGLVLALGIVTLLVVVVLMAAVSLRMLALTATGLARTALIVAALTVVSFGLGEALLGGFGAAVVGLAVYTGALAALRPRGLVEAWRYMRVLHD